MEMGDQYGLPDLRRFLARRTHFPATQQPSEPYFVHRNVAPLAPYEAFMVTNNGLPMVPTGALLRFGGGHDNHHFSAAASASAFAGNGIGSSGSGSGSAIFGVEMENGGWSFGNFDGGNSRWPRQETLTLLEIRSRLDSKFKEANQKGPLWDEVSRIMAEEHGYQRSGKKCREKFENLYKYYKKTKEGKAGRQDGKNYRFFRQLEALYGETSNQSSLSGTNLAQKASLVSQTPNIQENRDHKLRSESLSFSNASEFETSSSENNNDQEDLSAIAFMMKHSMEEKQKRVINIESGSSSRDVNKIKGWKTKVKDLVESQMKKIIDSQDVWMERMLKTIEDKEQERMLKEEEWRRQEAARFEKEHEFWAKERAWVEARDASLMKVLKKFPSSAEEETHSQNTRKWAEHEVSSLIQLRKSLEPNRYSEERLWEEIEAKMVSLGYERDANECKEKWNTMQMYFNMTNAESYKKQKEDFRRRNSNSYFQQLDSYYGQGNSSNNNNNNENDNDSKQRGSPSSNSCVGTSHHQQLRDINSFHIALNQGDDQQHLWDRYRLKLSKEKNRQI
ncbi:hypothetical protein CCACVL1_05500 [Corchorus capsularis]|uniref:Myb-like domain-containing protein n=1 Tax=Corchorus capsularis TaxID=210143 RepID=A0A1R3JK08_COCAP|nr:hypothetical protein CCACVL1_05500 [Corchorus capsularis]